MTEIFYRYDDSSYTDEPPWLSEYNVVRKTRKGTWVSYAGIEKFVLDVAEKKYAYPTKELALRSYIIRKKRQIQHASNTHDKATANLSMAEALQRGEVPEKKSVFKFG